jgi:hypothetical protein
MPTLLLRPENVSSRFKGGSYTAVYSVPIEYQRNLADHWGRRSLREIALPTNNAGNVYTVVNGRIDIEEYRADKVLRNFGRAFNFPASDVI